MKPINLKTKRSLSGGSWYGYARYCRADDWVCDAPGHPNNWLGFLPVARFVRRKKK